jgi:anti-sigma regulatory factor (Ser/Thr protein kinase)
VTRSGAAAGYRGYFHEALCYGSEDEFIAVVTPFLLDGVAASEPALAIADEPTITLLRSALPAGSGVQFLPCAARAGRPAAAIRTYRKLLASHVAAGAAQIRIVGELTCLGQDPAWEWWSRYESATNLAYDDFPLWGLCAYDTRTTPALVLEDVSHTHPVLATTDGRHQRNAAYVEPRAYRPRPAPADPVEATVPLAELTDPTPARARAAVHAVAGGRLPVDEVEDLVVGVSEVVTNALRHGLPPVQVRLWAADGRVVVTVADGGPGPADPFAGLLPVPPTDTRAGGRGLWITFQACDHVTLSSTGAGFTARLTAGALPAPSAV